MPTLQTLVDQLTVNLANLKSAEILMNQSMSNVYTTVEQIIKESEKQGLIE